jgi:hypothetical protein
MTQYHNFDTASLDKQAASMSEAQRKMAADAKEDFTHWHHIAVADLIDELRFRLNKRSTADEIPITWDIYGP